MKSNAHRVARTGVALVAFTVITACGSAAAASSGGVNAATAQSATAFGGMSGLIAAAKQEGQLNVIALPPDWANYGAIIKGFTAKYGIKVNSANPNGSSQDEVNAVKSQSGTSRAPDVLDVGMAVALANTDLFAPYEVTEWNDIPSTQKDPGGLWYQDYGGYMSIGYDSSKFTITSVQDLLKPAFKGAVALNGNPTQANAALNGVMMASLANGGSLDNIAPGVAFFKQLNKIGNFVPVQATTATVKNGTTPVVFDWDYLSEAHGQDVPTWKVFVPSDAVLGGYYAQAISKTAPDPAAARLWEEYLYSVSGQNLFLQGGARPVEMAALTSAGSLNTTYAAALPPVDGTPVFLSPSQSTAAAAYLNANWAQAIGS